MPAMLNPLAEPAQRQPVSGVTVLPSCPTFFFAPALLIELVRVWCVWTRLCYPDRV